MHDEALTKSIVINTTKLTFGSNDKSTQVIDFNRVNRLAKKANYQMCEKDMNCKYL